MKKLIVLSICLLTILLSGCASQPAKTATRLMLDTVITVTVRGGDDGLLDDCFALIERLESKFSRTDENSELYRLNAAGGGEASGELLSLIESGIRCGKISGGAFDITLAPVSGLWDFKSDVGEVPAQKDISSALQKVGYENIKIKGNNVTLPDGAAIDLGGIAKGYIADRLAEFIRSRGAESALINLGGNVMCIGLENGKPYRIGVQKPFSETGETAAVIEAADGISVVTSGRYERYFEKDGVIYHHILDPETGYPAGSGLDSVTVISRSSAEADALSTACFVLGKEEGMRLIESLDGVEAVFIDTKGDITLTSGLADTGGDIKIK